MTGDMLKAFVATGLGSVLNMALGAATTKMVALFGGPSGLAVYAQLRQAAQLSVLLATLNGQNSIVRRANSGSGGPSRDFLHTVAVLFAVGIAAASLAVILMAPLIARALFSSTSEGLVVAIRFTSLAVAIGGCASFVLGVITSMSRVVVLAAITAGGSIATVLVAFPLLSSNLGFERYVFLPVAGFAAISVLGGWWVLVSHREVLLAVTRGRFSRSLAYEHISYSGAVMITGLAGSGAVVVLRSLYIHRGGLPLGGIFDSAWTVSMLYVTPLLSSFGTHYFPELSRNRFDPEYVRHRVSAVFLFSSVAGTLLVSFMVMLNPFIIHVLYSGSFSASRNILRWMLIGDYLKITSFVFGILLHVFAERRQLVISDLLFQGVLIGGTWLGIEHMSGAVGVAFAVVNVFYVAYIWRHAVRRYGVVIPSRSARIWLMGLFIILGLSAWRWSHSAPDLLFPVLVWAAISGLFLLFATRRDERLAVLRYLRSRIRLHPAGRP